MQVFTLFALTATLSATPTSEVPTENQVRDTIQKSVPYIEDRGLWWIEKKKCVSCHRVGTMVWSLAAAREKGVAVSDELDGWYDWALEKSLSQNDKGKTTGSGNMDGLVQLMFTGNAIPENEQRTEASDQFVSIIQQEQLEDGAWKPGGQLPSQKRPKPETTAVTTAWLALTLINRGDGKESSKQKALERLASVKAGKSTEWYVVRLLLALENENSMLVSQLVDELVGQQQEDGGWGWIVGESSDALGTGMSLYALQRAGCTNLNVIGRAKTFLVTQQSDNGSWKVKGTKANKRNRVEETASFWGTTWAVIALAESLPTVPVEEAGAGSSP